MSMSKNNGSDGPAKVPRSQREPPAPLLLESGETLIFSPPGLNSRRRPAVTLGRLAHGELVLHFRVYNRTGRGRYAISHVGCSFKPHELDAIVAKINELAAVLPELASARRKAS